MCAPRGQLSVASDCTEYGIVYFILFVHSIRWDYFEIIFLQITFEQNNIRFMQDKPKFDRIDFDILAKLQRDGRVSNKDLAAENAISPSTCLERVRRLKAVGAITGFHADVSPDALGVQVQALISVRLQQHAHIAFDKLMQETLANEEVVAVYLLAGAQDFLVHVATRDVAHLRSVVVDKFTTRDDVEHVETSLIFEYRRSPVLPNYER